MKISLHARGLLGLLLLLFAAGCGSDQPTAPQGSIGNASALLPISFYHVEDSDGGKPGEGVDAILLFEPNGIADLYVARDQEAIAYKGSYTIAEGRIALKFTDADFKPDVSFTIDTSQPTTTMPFKVFSEGDGSSTWRLERHPVEHNMQVVFNAATLAENAPTESAIDRVMAYTNAIVDIEKMAKPALAKRSLFDPKLTGVERMPNGVRLQFDDGPFVNVQLYGWIRSEGVPLTISPLAGDPRVHLDPVSPRNGADDPNEKTALIISPFDNDREDVIWYDYEFLNLKIPRSSAEPVQSGWGALYKTEEMAAKLESSGYSVHRLNDADAGVVGIIEAIAPGHGGRAHAPGFVTMITHGLAHGELSTGTFLGTDSSWRAAFEREKGEIKARGYGDLLTYDGGTEAKPHTLSVWEAAKSMRPGQSFHRVIAITPKFWEWLRVRKNASFDKSLVYIAACLTDKSDHLRKAIQARAYFAFNVSVKVGFAASIFQYLCTSLSRPTHSAEESYYNIIRVLNTRQMIYQEDKLLDMMSPIVDAQASQASAIFQGYAFDGEEIVSYQNAGWMKTANADPGVIWWLLFAARWGQNAHEGALGLKDCWDEYWSKGEMPGLANPACENKAPGRPPTAAEVAYASYLLDGKFAIPASAFKIPRWTLNDAR